MKVQITEIEADGGEYIEVFDFAKGTDELMKIYMYFANGLAKESRAVADEDKAIEILRGLILGGGKSIEITGEIEKSLKLYRQGDECYLQGRDCYFFINPTAQEL